MEIRGNSDTTYLGTQLPQAFFTTMWAKAVSSLFLMRTYGELLLREMMNTQVLGKPSSEIPVASIKM